MDTSRWPRRLAGMDTEDFLHRAEEFHGHVSPGVVAGAFMVEAAQQRLGPSEHLNAVVETVVCLPDAVQLLTPCTLGNGFLKVLDWGKFALTLYDRMTLAGVRAWLDPVRVARHELVAAWYLRRGTKVDKERVIAELLGVGRDLVSSRPVRLDAALKDTERFPTVVCPDCGETYPTRWGERCLACAGQAYYRPAE